MSIKQWNLRHFDEKEANMQDLGLPEILSRLLSARGINTPEEIEDFLGEEAPLSDPFELKDMDKAAERICRAIDLGEKIAVWGDYDCDGITSTAALYSYLLSSGADVIYHIPEREEGYGLNKASAKALKNQGVSLIITVDNGITAIKECEYIASLGMDIVITDHHQPGETLPKACAVVNPHRLDCKSKFKDLCGAGVTLKLIAALEGGEYFAAEEYFSDVVAIGTIADVVPLIGENRSIVKMGIKSLENTENLGLYALIEISGLKDKKITSENIAFGIAPRINAAGRMGSANTAMKLLLSEDEEEAGELAKELDLLNRQRQDEESKILKEIEEQLKVNPKLLNDRVIVIAGEGWHHGVIGIVSARITEKYGKPSVILSVLGDTATGSARSFGDFALYSALEACSELLLKFGGHKNAAGLTLSTDKIDSFREKINLYAMENFPEMPSLSLELDLSISGKDITPENAKALELMAPYGEKNPRPLFLIEKAQITDIYPLSGNRHLRLQLFHEGRPFTALLFGAGTNRFPFQKGSAVDLAVFMDLDDYDGNQRVSVKIKDIRPSGFAQKRYFAAKNTFDGLMRGESITPPLAERLLPSRDEAGVVYKYLKSKNGEPTTVDDIYLALYKTGINFGKILCAIEMFRELGFIETATVYGGISVAERPGKKSLEQSGLYIKIHTLLTGE